MAVRGLGRFLDAYNPLREAQSVKWSNSVEFSISECLLCAKCPARYYGDRHEKEQSVLLEETRNISLHYVAVSETQAPARAPNRQCEQR